MRVAGGAPSRGSHLLLLLSVFCSGAYILLRAITAGLVVFNPQAVFTDGIALVGVLAAVTSMLLSNGLLLPKRLVVLAISLLAVGCIAALFRAGEEGYFYPAFNLFADWVADLLIFIAIVLTARMKSVFRFYAASIGGATAIVGVYALYQRLFALEYLRDIAVNSSAFKENIRALGEVAAQAFIKRMEEGWVGGGLGSNLALAAFALLFIFFFFGVRVGNKRGFVLDGAMFMGLVCVVISGSMLGILVAKICEIILLRRVVKYPAGKGRDLLLACGGVGVLSLFGVMLTLGVWLLAGNIAAQLVLAVLWYIEIELLRLRYSSGQNKPAEYLVGILMLVFLLVLMCMFWLLPGNNELGYLRELYRYKLSAYTGAIQAGIAAFQQSPVLGWGLDNFSEVRSLFVLPGASAQGRVGNLYVQLLADGGILLLLGVLAGSGLLLFGGDVERRAYKDIAVEPDFLYRAGNYLVAGCFVLTYGLVFLGFFDHMGLEYLLRELFSTPDSFIARGLSTFPLFINLLVVLLLLPLAGILGFKMVWLLSRDLEFAFTAMALRVSLLAFLVFSLGFDSLYHPTLSGFFMVGMGLLVARQQIWGRLNLKPIKAKIIAYMVVILGLAWGAWGVWAGFVCASSERLTSLAALRAEKSEDLQQAIAAYTLALKLAEGNADYYVGRAVLQMRLVADNAGIPTAEELAAVTAAIEQAMTLRPYSSQYRITLAQILGRYAPLAEQQRVQELFQSAHKLYPSNPRYAYYYAKYLQEIGAQEAAREWARKAIELNSRHFRDLALSLGRYELYSARGIASSAE